MNANQIETQINPRIQHGRAVNVVAEYLRKSLSVPNIFIQPKTLAGFSSVDVLAVDHGGAGDLHAVIIKLQPEIDAGFTEEVTRRFGHLTTAERFARASKFMHEQFLPQRATEFHAELMALPAHYRYLAFLKEGYHSLLSHIELYSPDGIGRLGLITLTQSGDNHPQVVLEISPERFRIEAKKMATIDKFLERTKPDMEVRI